MVGEGPSGARRTVESACEWIASNRGEWERLRAACHRMMLEGYLVQRDSVYTVARELGIELRKGEFRRNHNLWSVLARYMAMLRPSMCGCMEFRETPVDRVDLVAVYEAVVGPADFVASSLAEARALYEAGWR